MESKVTDNGQFEKLVAVDVPKAELAPHFDNVYRKYQKHLKMEGFRRGKVPLGLIKKLYSDAVTGEVIDEVVQSVFQTVKENENLQLVAPAKVEDVNYDPEKGLHFKAKVEVIPEVEVKKYTELSIERELYEIDEEDVKAALADIQEQMAVMEPVEDEAREDDYVLADLQQVDAVGVPLIGKKFEDRYLQLKKDEHNRELTDQLLGIKSGESRQVELTSQDGNGQPQKDFYQIKVKEIKSKRLPDLDDELAKDVGEFENLDALKEDVRKKLITQSEANARRKSRQNLIDELLKNNSFDLPETMINNYLDLMVENLKKDSHELDEEKFRNEYRPTAIWNLKWELLRDKIKEIENINVTEEDKKSFIARLAAERGIDEKVVKASLKKDKNNRRRFEDNVEEKKILDFLEKNAKITERKITRKDIEKAQQVALTI